ncbi:hypothetical protein [Phage f2b1]|nr:hypothetical protein [Phage f2b1]
MEYINQTIIFPMGMKTHANADKGLGLEHHFDDCHFLMQNRRKTLKLKHAIRMRALDEQTTFTNCTIIMEGTFTPDLIAPYAIHKCWVYAKTVDDVVYEQGVKVLGTGVIQEL